MTFKTMRSIEWLPHRAPNWIYLAESEPLPLDANLADLSFSADYETRPSVSSAYSTANSYGVPSPTPERWQREMARAQELLTDGQILIASVQGSPELYKGRRELVADFIKVARLAAAVEPTAIELNLSCPNTVDFPGRAVRPPLCASNPALTREIVIEVREALPDVALIAKLSYLRPSPLGAVIASIATAVDGVAGINTLPATVQTRGGEPAFLGMEDDPAEARTVAGVSGVALRNAAVEFVASLACLKRINGWSFDILGMGGVMSADDAQRMLESGASAVQVATAALDHHALPAEIRLPVSLEGAL